MNNNFFCPFAGKNDSADYPLEFFFRFNTPAGKVSKSTTWFLAKCGVGK